jgi:hypothetical protein
MIHADVLEAGVGETLERRAEDLELRRLVGQVRSSNAGASSSRTLAE